MTELLVLLALTVLFMAFEDAAGTAMVVASSKNIGRAAGVLDACRDVGSRYGAVIAAACVVKWGIASWETTAVVLTAGVTSCLTTSYATAISHEFFGRDPRRMHRWIRKLVER